MARTHKLVRVVKDVKGNAKRKTLRYGDKAVIDKWAKRLNRCEDFYGVVGFIVEKV